MQKKILVVDDTRSMRDFLEEILEEDHYKVKCAGTGEEALDILKTYKPDLILLDIVMPGIDGYEVCRKIRSDPDTGFLKIIMVSSRNQLEERLEGYSAGADDYFGKPFDKMELLAKVKVFLRLKSVEDQLQNLNENLNRQVYVRTRQLVEAEKMAALGRLTAGIIHNLNNPLGAVIGTTELLTLKYPDEKLIMLQRKASSQMTRIISNILTTSRRKSEEEPEDLNLNEILNDQIELFNIDSFFKHKVHTKLILSSLPPYPGIYAHFSQSFANLIKNALDAMYESVEKKLEISSSVEKGVIMIRFADTGSGISKDMAGKIFNPFFTTKPRTSLSKGPTGTGLGLSYCMEIIKSYKGDIHLESESGKGSIFTVSLPLQDRDI